MKKLTKRENMLIYIMRLFIVTMGLIYFLILPQRNKFNDNNEKLASLEMDNVITSYSIHYTKLYDNNN